MSLDITADPGGSKKLRPGRPTFPVLALLVASTFLASQSPASTPSAGSDPGRGSLAKTSAAIAGIPDGVKDAIWQAGRGSFAPEPADGPALIRLDGGFEFDPQASPIEAQIPLELRGTAPAGPTRGYFIVQFKGPITQEDRAVIVSEGGRILGYIPDYALLVSLTGSASGRVTAHERVSWSGLYQPAYKLSQDPKMSEQGMIEIDILLFQEESLDEIGSLIAAAGGMSSRRATTGSTRSSGPRSTGPPLRRSLGSPASHGSSRSSTRFSTMTFANGSSRRGATATGTSGTWGFTARGR
jgi:hypothetical protein